MMEILGQKLEKGRIRQLLGRSMSDFPVLADLDASLSTYHHLTVEKLNELMRSIAAGCGEDLAFLMLKLLQHEEVGKKSVNDVREKVGNVCNYLLRYLDEKERLNDDKIFKWLVSSEHLTPLIDSIIQFDDNKLLVVLLDVLIKAFSEKKYIDALTDDTIAIIIDKTLPFIDASELIISQRACSLIESILIKRTLQLRLPVILTASMKHYKNQRASEYFIRYTTIIANVMASSDEHFCACSAMGAVDMIVSLLKSNDVLVQMVVLDQLMISFAHTYAGFEYMFTKGIIKGLITLACGDISDGIAPNSLLSTQALDLLGNIFAKLGHSLIVNNDANSPLQLLLANNDCQTLLSSFLQSVVININSADDVSKIAGIKSLSEFASSSFNNFRMVISDQNVLDCWINMINSKSDIVAQVLHSIAAVIESKHTIPVGGAAADTAFHRQLKIKLLRSIEQLKTVSVATYLIRVIRQPIEDARNGAYNLMRVISNESWGIDMLCNSPSFLEFICDRNTEFSKDGKEWKFLVIQGLFRHVEFLSPDYVKAITTLHQQGPFYMPTISGDILLGEK